jgi:pimeloyl-ACP methyl ester carboxylesterase
MPLLRINATPDGIALHDSPQSANRRIEQLAAGSAPVIIMIHGYKYQPFHPAHCPHESLFSLTSDTGWPTELLGVSQGQDDPLCIAFGWSSRGAFRTIHAHADDVSAMLARLVRFLNRLAPHRPVHLLSHSLGSQVALSALPRLKANDVQRVVLMTGATHLDHAQHMLTSPAGKTLELINVISRENDLIDLAFERLVPGGGAIGRGITADNVLNLQLDCTRSLSVLTDLGFPIAASDQRISHWSAYTRTGAMTFYAHAMLNPERLGLARLRRALPQAAEPHYCRLWGPAHSAISASETTGTSLVHRLKRRIMGPFRERGPDHEPAY